MKDCNGRNIAYKSLLMCINDVDYGRVYEVLSFVRTLCINIDGTNVPLKTFNVENGCLTDFERINRKCNEWCDNCDKEVFISSYEVSICPSCGKKIKPCSMCNMDIVDCANCRFDK